MRSRLKKNFELLWPTVVRSDIVANIMVHQQLTPELAKFNQRLSSEQRAACCSTGRYASHRRCITGIGGSMQAVVCE
jgi:hypothetical protein